ncbi:DUF3179 domain-containing (seleno)protein [Tundrisphaera lichenicola]|uniref:DUF3179 domain-containing (seleno)protein n=1 Tax=Tundrisphaera lichenicola TaxID=2029860 RepID=UPI003EBF75C5
MAQGDHDPSGQRPSTRLGMFWQYLTRGLCCVAMLPIVGFIGGQGLSLWDEYRGLKVDEVSARSNAVIGYVDISPNPSLAARPLEWHQDQGEHTLLWAGFRGDRHRWFQVGRDEVEIGDLSIPIGRDTIRTIDRPIYEQGSGRRWDRVPDEARVVGLEGDAEPPAYPIRVLDKVVAINDRYQDRPVLVVFTPIEEEVTVFRSEYEGRPVVMGQSGYFVGYRPLLYDRETESLWVERAGAMTSISGPRKGAILPRLGRVASVNWGDWKALHPDTRLLVGADRSGDGSTPPAP